MDVLRYLFWLKIYELSTQVEGCVVRLRNAAQTNKMALVTEVPGERRAW